MTEPTDRSPDSDAGALAETIAEPLSGPRSAADSSGSRSPSGRASRPTFPGTVTSATRYRVGAELGRGGMGRVVEAYDEQLARTVAVKEVLKSAGPDLAARFTREVEITARFEHPSIIPLYDSGVTADGRPFYVMRRVTGRPLSELLDRARSIGERLTLLPNVLAAIDAVAHAHRRRVIHRDLKPANILVGELGETVVIDWGLAKALDDDRPDLDTAPRTELDPATSDEGLHTQLGAVFGTPGFMPPEQARGDELGPRSDVYALGATLYMMLAGVPPHGGGRRSATEVIDRARSLPSPAVATLAPGAPAELTAIVDKAIAFEPAARYADAEALGADVRRFLAGQLVAAHRYTPRQRLIRFARRNRATLAVAAIGVVALAVLGAVSIARIVDERDAADVARRQAQVGKQEAEAARDHLADDNDALRISEARAYLGTLPTHAVAVLKHLSPSSHRIADARGVACEAAVRGAAWALPTEAEVESSLELAADGDLLLEGDRHALRAIDLVERRVVWSRTIPDLTRAAWVARGSRVLITRFDAQPSIFDPASGSDTQLTGAPIDYMRGDDSGQHFVLEESAEQGAEWLDVATRTVTPLSPPGRVTGVGIDPAAHWALFTDHKRAVVVRPDGSELGHLDGDWVTVAVSHNGAIALSDAIQFAVGSVDAATGAVHWEVHPAGTSPTGPLMFVQYRDESLYLGLWDGRVLSWTGKDLVTVTIAPHAVYPGVQVGGNLMVMADSAGGVRVLGTRREDPLALPITMANPRLVGRTDKSRLVIAGSGLVAVWDMSAFVTSHVDAPGASSVYPVDDSTLLVGSGSPNDWFWLDLRTSARTPVSIADTPLITITASTPDGRFLARTQSTDGTWLVAIKRGVPTRKIMTGEGPFGVLMPEGGGVYTSGDDRVMVDSDDGKPLREVAKLDSKVNAVAALGSNRYAAVSARGELVRGSVTTGEIERAQTDVGDPWLIAGSDGDVMVCSGPRLYAWGAGSSLKLLASFEDNIEFARPVAGGELIVLHSNRAYLLDVKAGARPEPVLPEGPDLPMVSGDGKVIGSLEIGGVTIVELPSRTRWTYPVSMYGRSPRWLMPTTRKLGNLDGPDLKMWQLPPVDRDLQPWLEELTNAVDVDSVLTWPWQRAAPTQPSP